MEFTPLGAYTCLGVPMHHLANTLVDPDAVLGRGWTATVTGRLAAAPGLGSTLRRS
ncbi:hypothetical protein [Streptomyces sp. V1I6]|uniref:hypothetical protein n=1 Tax=Streptomyces sp. V1I6 TaxID=3042273 RepID=UPI0035939DA2